jgi:hypothetical protein
MSKIQEEPRGLVSAQQALVRLVLVSLALDQAVPDCLDALDQA